VGDVRDQGRRVPDREPRVPDPRPDVRHPRRKDGEPPADGLRRQVDLQCHLGGALHQLDPDREGDRLADRQVLDSRRAGFAAPGFGFDVRVRFISSVGVDSTSTVATSDAARSRPPALTAAGCDEYVIAAVLLTCAVSNPTVYLSGFFVLQGGAGNTTMTKGTVAASGAAGDEDVRVTVESFLRADLPLVVRYRARLNPSSSTRSYAAAVEAVVCAIDTVYCTRSQASPEADESVRITTPVLLIVSRGSTISASAVAACAGAHAVGQSRQTGGFKTRRPRPCLRASFFLGGVFTLFSAGLGLHAMHRWMYPAACVRFTLPIALRALRLEHCASSIMQATLMREPIKKSTQISAAKIPKR
jgi:hypothetical protein